MGLFDKINDVAGGIKDAVLDDDAVVDFLGLKADKKPGGIGASLKDTARRAYKSPGGVDLGKLNAATNFILPSPKAVVDLGKEIRHGGLKDPKTLAQTLLYGLALVPETRIANRGAYKLVNSTRRTTKYGDRFGVPLEVANMLRLKEGARVLRDADEGIANGKVIDRLTSVSKSLENFAKLGLRDDPMYKSLERGRDQALKEIDRYLNPSLLRKIRKQFDIPTLPKSTTNPIGWDKVGLKGMKDGGALLTGPSLIHVGERKPGDKKYATDEYLFAMPGSIVAPRLLTEEPTPENAAKAILAQGKKLGLLGPKATEADLAGGASMNGPAAYKAYAKAATGSRSRLGKAKSGGAVRPTMKTRQNRGSGPPALRKLTKAEAGMAINPYAEALEAIRLVQSSYPAGEKTPEQAAGILNNPQDSAPASGTIPVAEGGAAFNAFLQQLLGAAGITGPDLMVAQNSIFSSLGMIDPRAIGVTDPAKFRSIIGEGMGMPTLDKQKQNFQESLYGFSRSSPNRGNVPQVAG